jgi:hypothetical protein
MSRARHFLICSDAPHRKHEVELTAADVRLLDLVPCGRFESGDVSETYWVLRGHPAGDHDGSWSIEPEDG